MSSQFHKFVEDFSLFLFSTSIHRHATGKHSAVFLYIFHIFHPRQAHQGTTIPPHPAASQAQGNFPLCFAYARHAVPFVTALAVKVAVRQLFNRPGGTLLKKTAILVGWLSFENFLEVSR